MSDLKHIAIILDGNGRWAKSKGMPRTYGHTAGSKNVETIIRAAKNLGVEYMTLYAFSTENWKRSSAEVEAIMALLMEYLNKCKRLADENEMRVRVIGDKSGLSAKLQDKIAEVEAHSKDYNSFHLDVAINYGGRDEITRAVKRIVEELAGGLDGALVNESTEPKVSVSDITPEFIAKHLDTNGSPDPDLLIRTGGEERISNFLLWQLAYTEFVFTDVYWPDFDEAELKKCIDIYNERNRRFGNA